jgi:polyphenol oxidase
VVENHKRIYRILGYPFNSRFDVWQVHGTRIMVANEPRGVGKPHSKADGILTHNSEITLFMRFADCVPVILYDPQQHVIGIAHAGWQGTCERVASAAVEKMIEHFGSKAEDILAGIGPSICRRCYEVGDDVYQAFHSQFGAETSTFFYRTGTGLYLDLWEVNEMTLRDVGVTQIETSGICTACNLQDWYSHRAEGGKTGRFGVLMSLKKR